ncbi:unnamed protein product, partial [marine sediment metagenome]
MQETKIWPIGKALACFVNGFVFKPEAKYFNYHGMRMICTKIGKMKPFECRRFDIKEKWEVIFDKGEFRP